MVLMLDMRNDERKRIAVHTTWDRTLLDVLDRWAEAQPYRISRAGAIEEFVREGLERRGLDVPPKEARTRRSQADLARRERAKRKGEQDEDRGR